MLKPVQQSPRTNMPSPSRIPRPKVHAVKKPGKENVQKAKAQSQGQDMMVGNAPAKKMVRRPAVKPAVKMSVKTTMIQTQKKSPLRVVSENKFRQTKTEYRSPPKTILHDRRGISEIKKSEKNLRMALETMENKLESLKLHFNEAKYEVMQKEQEVDSLHQRESELEERLKSLENMNSVQAEALEKLNCDPVTGSKLSCDILTSVAEKKGQDKIPPVNSLLQQISDMKLSLSKIQNQLDLDS